MELRYSVYIEDYESYEDFDAEYIYDAASEDEREYFYTRYCDEYGAAPVSRPTEDDLNYTEVENAVHKILEINPEEFGNLPDELLEQFNERFNTNFVKVEKKVATPSLSDEIAFMQQLYDANPSAELKHEIDLLKQSL